MVNNRFLRACIASLYGSAIGPVRRSFQSGCGLAPSREGMPESAAKPLRPIIVPASFADLHGPSAGIVELPVRLYWSAGSRTFDLADHDQVASMYDAVLDAASTMADIASFVNADLLVRTWPTLSIGRPKREGWEERFPVLRRLRLEAAA